MRCWGRAIVIALTLALGCDEATIQPNRGAAPQLDAGSGRLVVSAQGLAQLTRYTAEQQLQLESAAQPITLDGEPVAQMGPLEQPITIVSLTAQPEPGRLRTIIGLGQPVVQIPLRLGAGADTRICRWRVALTSAALEVRSEVEALATAQQVPARLVPQGAATVSWASAQLSELGACGLTAAARVQLQSALTDYTRQAIAQAAASAATLEPVAALGVPDGALEVTHITPFESRRGQLTVGVTPSAMRLASDGLSVELDLGALAKAASCAPPNEGDGRAPMSATQPAEQELRQRRADAALVITLPALERLAQSLLRAGFGCRGLEDMSSPQLSKNYVISRSEARLGDVGIVGELAGEQLAAVVNPGEAVRLELVPGDGVITAQLRRLSIELHGEVAGVMTQLATLRADVTLRLIPRGSGDSSLVLSVDNAAVDSPVLTSEWRGESPSGEVLTTWARRLILLLLDEEIVLPAPILPTTPLSLIGAQVRTHDLVLYWRL